MHLQVKASDNDTNNIYIDKQTANKVDVTYLLFIEKEIIYTWCIYCLICNKTGMVDALSS